jgi:hypothetical protein
MPPSGASRLQVRNPKRLTQNNLNSILCFLFLPPFLGKGGSKSREQKKFTGILSSLRTKTQGLIDVAFCLPRLVRVGFRLNFFNARKPQPKPNCIFSKKKTTGMLLRSFCTGSRRLASSDRCQDPPVCKVCSDGDYHANTAGYQDGLQVLAKEMKHVSPSQTGYQYSFF